VQTSLQDRLKAKNPNYNQLIAQGYPVDYILEQVNILGLEFKLNKNVLIPRPETEWLIQGLNEIFKGNSFEGLKIANQFLDNLKLRDNRRLLVDIGTGSGLIALGLSQNFEKVLATDKYLKALNVATENSRLNNITNIDFIQSDLLINPILREKLKSKHFVLIANLPYVPDSDLPLAEKNKISFEPKSAIYSGSDGLKHFKRIIKQIKKFELKPGLCIFELDPRNIQKAYNLGKKYFPKQIIINDYTDTPRFLFCTSI
jgi:release factor glutamine methyltransferase